MDTAEAGRKGGKSRSEAKRAASARNLEGARAARERIRKMIPEVEADIADLKEKGVTDTSAERWLKDARWLLDHPTPTNARPTIVLVAQQKAGS